MERTAWKESPARGKGSREVGRVGKGRGVLQAVGGWMMKMWPCVRMNSLQWSASVCGRHLFSFPVSSRPATCCVAIQSNSTVGDHSLGNRVLCVRKPMFLLLFHKRLIQEVSLEALNLKGDACVYVHVVA